MSLLLDTSVLIWWLEESSRLGKQAREMITGEPPFQSASPRELLNLQCTAEPAAFGEEIEAPAGVCELVFELHHPPDAGMRWRC